MDGLLVDSEPLWKEAETEVYGGAGVPVTPKRAAATKGLRLAEVAAYWARVRRFDADPADLASRVVAGVVRRIGERAVLLPGAREAIAFVRARGLPVALASSSPRAVIDAVLGRFGLGGAFDAVVSGEEEEYGKPHPAIYLSACRALRVEPVDAVAFEDSVNGLVAAKAARMPCVAVPSPEERADPRFALADLVLPSLAGLTEAAWAALPTSAS